MNSKEPVTSLATGSVRAGYMAGRRYKALS